ncbi:GntR family transcriptional regulator [Rhodococcus wratislaviensis]|uniref:GntR family transcriptional regulator n=1 Tax=Rhodococcus wratislaviensis TaxID=44752 RepID=UPI0035195D1A
MLAVRVPGSPCTIDSADTLDYCVMQAGSISPVAAGAQRLGAQVYELLKQRLLDGQWAAGESIPVEALKREFGVSKQPIMEALRRLASDDLVEIIPQVGSRVPVFTPREISDFFLLFASLEAEAAAIATTRGTAAQIQALEEINARIGAALVLDADARALAYREYNREFHQAILEMSSSAVVQRTSRRMWDMSDLLITTTFDGVRALADEVCDRHADHNDLIEGFRRRDDAAVRTIMRHHLLRNVPMLAGLPGDEGR